MKTINFITKIRSLSKFAQLKIHGIHYELIEKLTHIKCNQGPNHMEVISIEAKPLENKLKHNQEELNKLKLRLRSHHFVMLVLLLNSSP